MNAEVVGVHYHVSDATREYIQKKIEFFNNYLESIERLHITIKSIHEHSKEVYEVHIHGKLNRHHAPTMDVKRSGDPLWITIDDAFDAFIQIVHKYKDKHNKISHKRIQMQ